MTKGRIIFIAIVAIISIALIFFTMNLKGYQKIGRVNEYVLYYDETLVSDIEYSGYILKQGFYEVTLIEALEKDELSIEYQRIIFDMILEWEAIHEEND